MQYREIDYPTGEPGFFFDNFDSPDYGVELFLASGRVVSVIWSSRVLSSLDFIEDTLDRELKGYEVIWDVSTNSRWRDLLDVPITRALAYWGWGEVDDTYEVPALYGVGLSFETGAHADTRFGEYYDDRPELRGGEGVTVFFGEEVLRRYGMDPDQPTRYEARGKTSTGLAKMPGKASYFLGPIRIAKIDKSD